ncbi:AB hydrolase-1 domain-containing protein [Plasmodiophora brassicae]|uniref:AB hydrolase-1 domain-containing protein n=1 Tax=Plasmodiophora brassicae TaxID=37360 RepID=A0A0G4IPC8_PLABS|nr:hypothetical protein PBRA_005669 [Plasmodiophora brassicae]SPR01046.1 unnamed protein product [Plasmodiophora brassicae]
MGVNVVLVTSAVAAVAFGVFLRRRRRTERNAVVYCGTARNARIMGKCPALHDVYEVPALLSNGIIHTMVTAIRRMPPEHDVKHKRVRVPVDAVDDVPIFVDFVLPHDGPDMPDRRKPMILMLHGLNGCSNAVYIHWMNWAAHQHGYTCCCLNNRGSGGTVLASPRGYNAAHTGDVRRAVDWLREEVLDPDTPLFMIGFSLGAGILVKYLSEESTRAIGKVHGAVALCASFNMHKSSVQLERPFSVKKVIINRYLARGLVQYARRHHHVLQMGETLINWKAVFRATTVRQFDTELVVPIFGFRDVVHYYDECSTDSRIHAVGVPLLCVNADDDPICPSHGIPVDVFASGTNENLFLTVVPSGGHVGFLHSAFDLGHSFMERASLQFINAVCDEATLSKSGADLFAA